MSPVTLETVLPLHSVEDLHSVIARYDSGGCAKFSPKCKPFMPVQVGEGYWYWRTWSNVSHVVDVQKSRKEYLLMEERFLLR